MEPNNYSVGNKFQTVKNTIKRYITPELGTDLAGIVIFSSLYDFLGGGIDNPLPNIANGSGSLGGLHLLLGQGKKATSRYKRGIERSIAVASIATIIQMFTDNHDGVSDYLVDVFSNTLRYAGGAIIPMVVYAIYPHGGGDGDGDDEPSDNPPPDSPKTEPIPPSGRNLEKLFRL